MRKDFYLLLQNSYYSYCCHGGKCNELYFLADLTTVQALHSSIQSLYIYVNMINIKKVPVVMKVLKVTTLVQLHTLVFYTGEHGL